MQHDTADNLYGIRLDADNTVHGFTQHGERVRKNVVKSFTLSQTLFQHIGLIFEFLVRHGLIHRLTVKDSLLCSFYSL